MTMSWSVKFHGEFVPEFGSLQMRLQYTPPLQIDVWNYS